MNAIPPVSTTSNRLLRHIAIALTRSRVTPASSCTMDTRRPTMRLKSALLPTFGLPTMTMAPSAGAEFPAPAVRAKPSSGPDAEGRCPPGGGPTSADRACGPLVSIGVISVLTSGWLCRLLPRGDPPLPLRPAPGGPLARKELGKASAPCSQIRLYAVLDAAAAASSVSTSARKRRYAWCRAVRRRATARPLTVSPIS